MIAELGVFEFCRDRVGSDRLYVSLLDEEKDMHAWLCQLRQYEPHMQSLLSSIIQPHMTVLDLGANCGIHTCLMSKLAKRVIAVEACPRIYRHLLETLRINGCTNVETHNVGLWDRKTTLEFYFDPQWPGGSSLSFAKRGNTEPEEISVMPLDDLVAEPVDLVKLDVEGAEKFVLRGGCRIFDSLPVLLLEMNRHCTNTFFDYDVMDVAHQAMAFGYRNIFKHIDDKWGQVTISQLAESTDMVSDVLFLRKEVLIS